MLAADGAHSTIRKKLGIPFDGETFKNEMYLVDYELLNPQPEPIFEGYIESNRSLSCFSITKDTVQLDGNTSNYMELVPKKLKLGKEIKSSTYRVSHRVAQ